MSQRYIRRRRASALQPAPSGCCGVVHGLLRSRLVSVAPTSADKRDAEQAASHARYRTAAQQSVKEFHARDEACGLMMTSGFVIDPDSILKTIWDILREQPRFFHRAWAQLAPSLTWCHSSAQ